MARSLLYFDPMPDQQSAVAHVALENGLTKEVPITLVINEEYSDIVNYHFYYNNDKITNEVQARKHKIVAITLTKIIRINI